MAKNKGITLFGLSGVLLFLFAPVLLPIWFMFWIMKTVFVVMWNTAILIPKLIVKAFRSAKRD